MVVSPNWCKLELGSLLITDSWEVAHMLSIGIEIDGLEWPLCTLLHYVFV